MSAAAVSAARRRTSIDVRLERLYERRGVRYLRAWVPFQIVALGLLAVAGAFVCSRYVPMSAGELVAASLVGLCTVSLCTGLAAWRILAEAQPIQRWLAHDRPGGDEAVAAWRVAAGLPVRAALVQSWIAAAFGLAPWTAFLALQLDLSLENTALVAAASLSAGAFPTVAAASMYQLFLRPLMLDLARHLPPGFVPKRRVGLRRQLLVLFLLVNVAAGAGLGLVSTAATGGTLEQLGLDIGLAVAVACTASFLLAVLLVESILVPVQELLGGAEHMLAGGPPPRVPIASADELGELAAGLNAAVGALAEQASLRERMSALEAEAARQRRAREAELDRAAAAERTRVARELHDVVAHCVTVTVVQAAAAQDAPDAAAAAPRVAAIQRSAAEALVEMRRLVSVLRAGEGPAEPRRGLADVAELVDVIRDAGLAVDIRSDGWGGPLPGVVDASCYRILQEALTNVLKHAAASHVDVVIHRRAGEIELAVRDDGVGRSAPASAGRRDGGHGLPGMRERVTLLGGELTAGACTGGKGFEVRARLPRG